MYLCKGVLMFYLYEKANKHVHMTKLSSRNELLAHKKDTDTLCHTEAGLICAGLRLRAATVLEGN